MQTRFEWIASTTAGLGSRHGIVIPGRCWSGIGAFKTEENARRMFGMNYAVEDAAKKCGRPAIGPNDRIQDRAYYASVCTAEDEHKDGQNHRLIALAFGAAALLSIPITGAYQACLVSHGPSGCLVAFVLTIRPWMNDA